MKPQDGILLIDKTRGLTSHKAIYRLRRVMGIRRIGHTGTLDPMATGLLLACLGKATRLSRFFSILTKEYVGEFILGQTSNTYDREGEITILEPHPDVTRDALEEVFDSMTGLQWQQPPPFSALKVKGKPLYHYSRKGEKVNIPRRKVIIYDFDLIHYENPVVRFRIKVSSGTYIRSIAHDIGQKLECGALLGTLRRTYIGRFCVDNACTLENYKENPAPAHENVISIYDGCDFLPRLIVNEKGYALIKNGHPVPEATVQSRSEGEEANSHEVLVFDVNKHCIAIARRETKIAEEDVVYIPQRVLVSPD